MISNTNIRSTAWNNLKQDIGVAVGAIILFLRKAFTNLFEVVSLNVLIILNYFFYLINKLYFMNQSLSN